MGKFTKKSSAIQTDARIELAIMSSDLLLRGEFSVWDAGVTMGPDLDNLRVRLMIDATSASDSVNVAAEETAPLFSLRSRSVREVKAGVYEILGELEGVNGVRELEITLETPVAHTAVCFLSFDAKRLDFGDRFADLLGHIAPVQPEEGEPTRAAHAWLTIPELAAA